MMFCSSRESAKCYRRNGIAYVGNFVFEQSNSFGKMSFHKSFGNRDRSLLGEPDDERSSSAIPSLLSTQIEPPRPNINLPTKLISPTTQELTVGNEVMLAALD